ncbi:MAG: FtsW/RodA/SpoVE family cell cycle protein [Anaerolineae bacterium]
MRKHRTERALLIVAALFVLIHTLALGLERGTPDGWVHAALWGVCAIGGHVLLNYRLPSRDPLLFPLAMFMSGWGILLIDRLVPPLANRQTQWLVIAVLVMLIVAWPSHLLRLMRAYRYTLLFGGLAILAVTILIGVNPSDPEGVYGAPALWIPLGSFYAQPSEALKIVLVVFLASYLAEQYPALRAEGLESARRRFSLSPRVFGPILLMWGLSVVVLIWQRDLGTAILFFLVFLTLLYIASGYTPLLISGALMIVIAAVIAYQLFGVVRLRVDIWLNPWSEADGRAYQIVQSLMAFAAGGVFGQGIGQGSPLFIPVVHSDFVLAAAAEEWGLIGVIGIIACQATFAMRGLRTAIGQRGKPFHTLLAVGLSSVIAIQSMLIMGGVLKLIPLTGVTLPFFSYGGSSLVVTFAILGLLIRLSNEDT